MAAMLEFISVNKTFHQRRKSIHALRDVSFNVNEGEVFGFVGPNGAGKSTTIKVMLDIIRDYKGEVAIFGKSARDAKSRCNVSYLPESPALYDQFTPLEIVKMALRMNGIRRKDEDAWCMQWLERFSVAQNAKRKVSQLSKGNVQRVALAHAMVVEPKLLVLDEPLSGLDPVGRKDVIDILEEYKNNGGAIFFTSHVLHDVERIADRFGFINEGKLLTTRSPRELVTEHADRFIIRYHTMNNTGLDGTQLRENEFHHGLTQSEMPHWLEKLNQRDGKIIEIKPAVSLESVFFKILEESSTGVMQEITP